MTGMRRPKEKKINTDFSFLTILMASRMRGPKLVGPDKSTVGTISVYLDSTSWKVLQGLSGKNGKTLAKK